MDDDTQPIIDNGIAILPDPPSQSPCAAVDQAMVELERHSEPGGGLLDLGEPHDLDAIAFVLQALYRCGFEDGQRVAVHDRPEPHEVDVGDTVEFPTFIASWSCHRKTGKVAKVERGYATILHVEVDEHGRVVESETVIAVRHCKTIRRAGASP
jgi:hypothetical protein